MPYKQDPGFVYFVQAVPGGMIKIGRSLNPNRRLMALQGGSPVRLELIGVTPGSMETEEQLHAAFGDVRSHGEWFHPTESLLRYIADHAAKQPPAIDEQERLRMGEETYRRVVAHIQARMESGRETVNSPN